ncbi:hypothetical protein [Methylobacterium aquaticum]|uniref:Uncharacterized protein n=1 Tax=Methylobacterium aquaticum TaxID=270351 RepID=A0A0J6S4G3_9HYPH|nr:hypothetical protein [Methylobacterium aquaticum]KMO28544.1 hypothetical protein VP06_27095 [Methylobacterium aquaticum]
MSRPVILPTGHSPHVARRIISGDHVMPPLRAEDLFQRPANDRTGVVYGLIAIFGLVAGFILLGVGAFMIGRGL